ncbi:MAG: glycosyltransferase family 2 protein [Rhodobacteraceae bacterium]|nr:glycosyltransferase family 2 protein [Paracoccaceae bacterium]
MAPRVSVLLPTHQRPDTIGLAIRSILAQRMDDFELLVVGDGAGADTAGVVRSFDDSRVKWYDLPKAPGIGYANRNIALKEAKGALIAYAQDDDLFLPDHLRQMCQLFDRRKTVDWAYCRPLWVSNHCRILPSFANIETPRARNEFMTQRNFVPSSCIMHRRSCFADVGYWPEDGESQDWHLWKKIILAGGQSCAGFQPVPGVLHFRANWRTTPRWTMPQLMSLESESRNAPHWPRQLKFEHVETDQTIQQSLWTLIEGKNGPAFQIRLQVGLVHLSDTLHWSGSSGLY